MDSPRPSETIIQISANRNGVFALSNYQRIYYKSNHFNKWELLPKINFEELNNDK